jgi:transcriptional regulator GlxA family with amidase domain
VHLPSRRLDCWTAVERRRTGDMRPAFSESTHPSALRQIVFSVGTATYGLRQASRPASILRWLLIEEDHGFAIAKGVAQHLVVYHRRHGGQSQFAASVDLAPKNDRIAATLGYARDHIAEVLTVERLAEAAGMSLRQFSRAFRAQTGITPARVVERLPADLARGRIETTAEPVERIAEAVGFGDAENMRRAFIRIYGQPPQSIRRAIRS